MITADTLITLTWEQNWSTNIKDLSEEAKELISEIKGGNTEITEDMYIDIISDTGYEGLGIFCYLYSHRTYAQVTYATYDNIKSPGMCDYSDTSIIDEALRLLIENGYIVQHEDMYFFPKMVNITLYENIFKLAYEFSENKPVNRIPDLNFWLIYAEGLIKVKNKSKDETVAAFKLLSEKQQA